MAVRRGEHFLHRGPANGHYDVAALQVRRVARFHTNKPPCGPKRGHGTPQPRYALEVQLDKIAEQLRLDPAEMRTGPSGRAEFSNRELPAHRSMGLGACIDK